jgi:hypothetical protein
MDDNAQLLPLGKGRTEQFILPHVKQPYRQGYDTPPEVLPVKEAR